MDNLNCFKNDKCLGLLLLLLFIECFLYARHWWSIFFLSSVFLRTIVVAVQLLSCVRLFATPMDCNVPGLPVLQYLLEFTQVHVHWIGDAIQPSHPLSPPSPPATNLSQHQGLSQRVSSLPQVAKVLGRHKNHVGGLLASVYTQRCWETLLNWAEVSQPAVKPLFLC